MSLKLDPLILNETKKYISQGYNLHKILQEYDSEMDLDLQFINEICVAYYHCNSGPDLRNYQLDTVNQVIKHFRENPRSNYQLRWCCGLGKTKTASTIIKRGNYRNICIGLPSVLLLEQFYQELRLFFPGINIHLVYGGSEEGDIKNKISKRDALHKYLISSRRYKIVLTTYNSAIKVAQENYEFDLLVADEAHHLEKKGQKLFSHFLKIKSQKRLFLTATPNIKPENKVSYSFENSQVFQGEQDTKSVSWAVENNYISNYRLVILNMSEVDFLEIKYLIEEYGSKELILSAFMAVKAIYQRISTKILIYSNSIKNSEKIKEIIDRLLLDYPKLFGLEKKQIVNFELYGKHNQKERESIMLQFKRAKLGIMSSVQLFGEGFDYPELDTVLFSEKMSSDVRIIQSGLRPCRKNPNDENKVAHILIPIQDDDYSKVKQVLGKLKQVDNIRNKISIVSNSNFTLSEIRKFRIDSKFHMSSEVLQVLQKVELLICDRNDIKKDLPDMTSSKIIRYQLNNISGNKKRYKPILVDIFKLMGSENVKKYSQINIKNEKYNMKGYKWNPELGISFQGLDANRTLSEIIRLSKKFNYSLHIDIELKNGKNYQVHL